MRRSRMPRCGKPGGDLRRNLWMQPWTDVLETDSDGVYRYNICCLSSVHLNPDNINIPASGVHQCNLGSAA